ncbi:MAG TPA: GAP family protein [Solirubrobacteraceae bacterium]
MSPQLIILVVSIGLADSLNPGTIGPALFLATTARPRAQVAEFAAGIFAVNLVGGALIAIGPGHLLLSLLPKPHPTAKHILEVAAGAALLVAAAVVLAHRKRLRQRRLTPRETGKRSGFVLGAAISAIELPTALPYFAAIAAIVGSDARVPGEILLLALFNVAFLAPVWAILAVLWIARGHADPVLARLGERLERHWPTLVGVLLGAVGLAALGFGVVGLVRG